MQLQSLLASSLLIFSTLAIAEEVIYVTETSVYTSYSVVKTVTSTGKAPKNPDQVFVVDSAPITTIIPDGIVSTGIPTITGNMTEPTTPPEPTSTTEPTGAAPGAFGGSTTVVAAVGIMVVILGSML